MILKSVKLLVAIIAGSVTLSTYALDFSAEIKKQDVLAMNVQKTLGSKQPHISQDQKTDNSGLKVSLIPAKALKKTSY